MRKSRHPRTNPFLRGEAAVGRLERQCNARRAVHEAAQEASPTDGPASTPEEERRTKAAMYLGRAAAAVEENNQKQMLSGAEREAERRQRVAREAAERYQRVTREDRRQVEENTRKREARKLNLYKKKQREFDAARERLMEEQRNEMRERQENFKAARQKAKDVRLKIVEHNPYADAISRESVANAKMLANTKATTRLNTSSSMTKKNDTEGNNDNTAINSYMKPPKTAERRGFTEADLTSDGFMGEIDTITEARCKVPPKRGCGA